MIREIREGEDISHLLTDPPLPDLRAYALEETRRLGQLYRESSDDLDTREEAWARLRSLCSVWGSVVEEACGLTLHSPPTSEPFRLTP